MLFELIIYIVYGTNFLSSDLLAEAASIMRNLLLRATNAVTITQSNTAFTDGSPIRILFRAESASAHALSSLTSTSTPFSPRKRE